MGVTRSVVGCYALGVTDVDVYLREGRGGEYYMAPEPGKCPRIVLGRDGSWPELAVWLLHEAFEYAMDAHRCKYRVTCDFSGACESVSFMFTHAQFSVMADEVAIFVTKVTPELRRKWRPK